MMRFRMVAGVGFLMMSGILFGRTAEGASADCFRRLADDVCTVTSVVTDGNLKVEFVLRPEKGSNIRCRMELPTAGRWDGRMWGVGNSGRAGIFLPISQFAEAGSAVVTTDLGTHDYVDGEQRVLRVWPDCVRRDYDWRATHLMTVYAKRFVEAYYGRPPAKCYFNGGSCGGRQGIGEAIRFPEDYDGVIAHLTGNNPICNEIDDFAIWKHTHDANGKLLFTEADMRIVSTAAVMYRADREERPYAGRILGDPFFSDADVEGFLALAVKAEPRLGTDDLLERLRRIFLGVVHKGRRMTYGKIPGSYLGREMQETVHAYIPQFLMSRGMEKKDMTWDDLDEFVRIYAPSYNACSDDLDAFRRRGGKLIVTVGLEDQTDPPYAPLAHFERVVRRLGGDLAATMEFYRVFAVPGCAHGGGKGRAMTKSPDGPALWRQLADWREHGRAPERYITNWKSEGLELPVAPYPKRFVRDEKGAWVERSFDRRAIRSVDPYYLQCDTAPWRTDASATLSGR